MKVCVLLILAFLLVCLVPSSHGLKCYQCEMCSGIGELKECEPEDKYCYVKFIALFIIK